jgi:hypothetical protein
VNTIRTRVPMPTRSTSAFGASTPSAYDLATSTSPPRTDIGDNRSMSALGPKQTIPQPRANLPEMSMQLLGRQIHPTFENDTYVVLPSPSEVAFANCEKVVERDVEIYRKKSQSIRMQSSASRTDIVADADAHFSPKEQQSFDLLSAHLQSNPRYVAALALVL